MAHRQRYRQLLNQTMALVLLVLLSLAASYRACAEEDPQLAVVVNGDVAEKDLTLLDLRAIFSVRKRSWEDGQSIKIFVLRDSHPLHQQFCQSVMRSYAYVLRDLWDRMTFSGTGIAPTVLSSEKELHEKVAETAGAIGYIQLNNHSPPPSGLRIVYPTEPIPPYPENQQ